MNASELKDIKPSQSSVWQFFFLFEADSFYIDSLYNSILGVLLICVTVSVKSCSRNFLAVQSSLK